MDLGDEPVSDKTTICKFRHLLEAHDLGERIFNKTVKGAIQPATRS